MQFTAAKAPVTAILKNCQTMEISLVVGKIVILPTRINLPKVTLGADVYTPTTKASLLQFQQFILLIKTNERSAYSYLQIVNHPLLRRAHNVTSELQAADNLPLGHELHIINLENDLKIDNIITGVEVLSAMQELGVIPKDSTLCNHAHNLREMPVPKREQMRLIKKFAKSSVFVLWTRDLSRAFGLHRPRWQTQIKPFDKQD
ncbi:hypothetical protein N8Z54_04175 [Octadecabacter sp.]|nr:hypothetical protein [Octadecabacter sp.]